jgi:hypothetical protein
MKSRTLVFAGIARDNAADFLVMKKHIEYLGSLFKAYKVVLFENDSKDGTKELFSEWMRSNPNVHIISRNFNNTKRPNIQFLANARNYYLNYIVSHPQLSLFDILAVGDMDMKYGWDIRGIQDSFSKIDCWDGVGANGVFTANGKMWDAFAFRSKEFFSAPENPFNHSRESTYFREVTLIKIQREYQPKRGLVPVYSSFGGLAFYKLNKVGNCKYHSVKGDCEHVYLHKCMTENFNARLFLNPAMYIRYSHYK